MGTKYTNEEYLAWYNGLAEDAKTEVSEGIQRIKKCIYDKNEDEIGRYEEELREILIKYGF